MTRFCKLLIEKDKASNQAANQKQCTQKGKWMKLLHSTGGPNYVSLPEMILSCLHSFSNILHRINIHYLSSVHLLSIINRESCSIMLQDDQEYPELDQNSDSPLKRKSPYILKRQLRTNKSRRPYILKRNVYY
uniref:Neurotensin/neuromedin N n=1 Tax=Sinocyclocheilus grahami TaxID=75366 RepID=A0A672PUU0_SINGR